MDAKKRFACALVLAFACGLLFVPTASAQKNRTKRLNDAERRSARAARGFNEIMAVRESGIPRNLLDRAEAIAVFPGVIKAAFIIGGRGGQGVISRRVRGGWSAPAFFNLGGGSVGLQIGASKTDYVMLIMNDEGVRGLMEDKFELGGEAGVAAGPVGREAAASTNITLDAGILSYSRSKGLFAGVALKGAVINPDNDLNEAVYEGKKASQVLEQERDVNEMPAEVRAFPVTLSRYSRK
ncbi:MAG TPA: lipid-binding SYLF domain-containing protein [Pyrinomonadaceae bacterium]|nr:lipid-binding SYLF domain-containing protein [Pyrinomonadaceae bacterium]